MLQVDSISTFYGSSQILHGVSLKLDQSETVAVLGRNGVGKTTLAKSIMNLVRPRSGMVRFDGATISKLRPYMVPRLGIGYVPQGRQIFPELTVWENLKVSLSQAGKRRDNWLDYVFELFPVIKERLKQKAGTLSGGEQQMLTIGRALVIAPKVMLMDEPTEGLMPKLIDELEEAVTSINKKGVGILLIEQNAAFALGICERSYIIEDGSIVYEGRSRELSGLKDILLKYIGAVG